MPTYVSGADLASTRYTPGTTAWSSALSNDLSQGYITQGQYDWAVQNPGMAIPMQAGTTANTQSSWDAFWGGLSSTAGVLFSGYARAQQMEYQRDLLESNLEFQRMQIESGPSTGFGGLNIWTMLAFGGVAILIMIVLKKTN